MAGPAEAIGTIKVMSKKWGKPVIINEADFDPKLYDRIKEVESNVPARRAELAALKTIQLRELAEGYGLSPEGKKDELVGRIFEYETEER